MQSKRIARLIFPLLLAASLPLAQAAEERMDVGEVAQLQEHARAVHGKKFRVLSEGSRVLFEDRLKTGDEARLKAVLKDESVVTLGENAEIVVDEFVYDPEESKGNLAVKVAKGAFLFVGGKIEGMKKSEVKITTPAGILGVRGTTVWGGPIDGGYGVLVLDGEVTVTAPGGEVTLKAGKATMIYGADGKPRAPHGWGKDRIARAVATISFKE